METDKNIASDRKQLKFYIFGNNISHSLSPKIHNTGFAYYGLPNHYSIHQTLAVDSSIDALIHAEAFGGASVTFPHKLNIGALLDDQSEAAHLIGAVNTVVPSGGKLRGDNTDWIGILNVLGNVVPTSSIVVGAGGAARAAVFALQHLGAKHITIVNRSRINAEKLAASFPLLQFTICAQLAGATSADVIVGCIPADDITEDDIPPHIFADKGVVIEMSYRPPVSALMKVARQQSKWRVADGVDVLKQQAYAQFEMWTGLKAPVKEVEDVLSKLLS